MWYFLEIRVVTRIVQFIIVIAKNSSKRVFLKADIILSNDTQNQGNVDG